MVTLKIVEKLLHSNVPDLDTIVLCHRDDVLLIRSDADAAHWVCMGIRQLVDHVLGLCIPDLDTAVIVSRHNIGFRPTDVHVKTFRL